MNHIRQYICKSEISNQKVFWSFTYMYRDTVKPAHLNQAVTCI